MDKIDKDYVIIYKNKQELILYTLINGNYLTLKTIKKNISI